LKVEKNQAVISKQELNTMWLVELKEQKKEVKKDEALKESKAGDKIGSVDNETRNEREVKLANLKLKRVTWVNDNDNYPRSQEELPHILSLGQDEDSNDEERDSLPIMTDPISWQDLRRKNVTP